MANLAAATLIPASTGIQATTNAGGAAETPIVTAPTASTSASLVPKLVPAANSKYFQNLARAQVSKPPQSISDDGPQRVAVGDDGAVPIDAAPSPALSARDLAHSNVGTRSSGQQPDDVAMVGSSGGHVPNGVGLSQVYRQYAGDRNTEVRSPLIRSRYHNI